MTKMRRLPLVALTAILIGCQAAPPGAVESSRTAAPRTPRPDGGIGLRKASPPSALVPYAGVEPEDAVGAVPPDAQRPGSAPPAEPPPPVGSELATALQDQLDRALREEEIPGLSLAVVLPDGSVWAATSGVAALETGVPLTPDTMFGVASITKPFIAALTVKLCEEGVLSLDDRLGDWVTEIPYGDEITIRQLLGHTSGIRDFFGEEVSLIPALLAEPDRPWTPEEVLAYLGPPYWEPGGGWRYSNSNYVLLGLVIQRATGRSVGEELRARILGPLELDQTFLQPDEVPVGPLADGHTRTRDEDADGRPDSTANGGPFRPDTAWASSVWTAGAMVSTATDVAAWGDALFGGRVVSAESLRQMVRFNSDDYGLGVQRERLSGRVSWGHSGLLRGFTGLMLHFPDDDLTVVVLTNQDRVALDEILMGRYRASRSLLQIAFGAAAGD